MADIRNLTVNAVGYKARVEQFEGREHLVVPVVALVEGVVRAMNSNGPEMVRAEKFLKQPIGWNGRPVFHGHPMRNGKPVSGNLPEILASQRIGVVFNSHGADNKLKMEAWIDTTRCESIAPELLSRAKAGEPIEISVGTFVDTIEETGVFNNKRYASSWNEIVPDHLALLPEDQEGACSRKMGCGVRVAAGNGSNQYSHVAAQAAHEAAANAHEKAAAATSDPNGMMATQAHELSKTAAIASHNVSGKPEAEATKALAAASAAVKSAQSNIGDPVEHHGNAAMHHRDAANYHKYQAQYTPRGRYAEGDNVEDQELDELITTLRSIPQDVRDKMPKEDFAGPNESFPIEQPVDVHDAAQALGRAKGDRASIKRKIIGIAYRKGADFVAQLPDDWKRKSDQKNASAFVRMMDFARGFFKAAQGAAEMSATDLRSSLTDALREAEPTFSYVEDYFPVTDPSHVVYSCYDPDDNGDCLFERPFTLSDAGVVQLGTARVEVQRIVTYEPADEAEPEVMSSGKGDPGSDKTESPATNNKESDMKREDVVTALSKATDCQIAAIGRILEGKTEEPKQPTEAELKAAADAEKAARAAEIKAAVDGAIKSLTFEQVLDKATPEVRAAVNAGGAEAKAKRESTIKALKDSGRCLFSDEDLAGFSQEKLEALAKMGNVATVDYSAQAPRAAAKSEGDKVAAPADMTERLRAARAKK
jgi:hypothetical protein